MQDFVSFLTPSREAAIQNDFAHRHRQAYAVNFKQYAADSAAASRVGQHQSRPFRVLAWVRARGVPETRGFGKFREGSESRDEAVTRLRVKISQLQSQEVALPSENAIAREAGLNPKLREDARPESVDLLAGDDQGKVPGDLMAKGESDEAGQALNQ